jgi:hypothetical protein
MVIAEFTAGWVLDLVLARPPGTVSSPFVDFRMAPSSAGALTISGQGVRSNGGPPADPAAPGPKVFVFGGSTTLGVGVGNAETIAAALERALAAAGRADVRVINFGTVGYFSTPERIAFEQGLIAGLKPDVAVFIDGLGDFDACVGSDRPVETSGARQSFGGLRDLVEGSTLVRLVRGLGGEGGRICRDEADLDAVIRRLDTNRRIIAAAAERMGVKVLFVQQPMPGFPANAARLRLAQARAQGRLWEHGLLWLADPTPEGGAEPSVDYSPQLNQAIGGRIAQAIVEGGYLPAQ